MTELDSEKLFYERFWALLSDRQLMRVFQRYGPAAFRRSSVLEGFEPFIKAQRFNGESCIEIGTFKGLTAIVLARYFKTVVSIDIMDDPQKLEIVNFLGITNVLFVNVKDNAAKAAAVESFRFDAAYVDGDHAHDTETDFNLVRRGGRVLCHEYWDAQPAVKNLYSRLNGNVVTSRKFALWTA